MPLQTPPVKSATVVLAVDGRRRARLPRMPERRDRPSGGAEDVDRAGRERGWQDGGQNMNDSLLPKHIGHYLRVGLATFFTCIAIRETFQNGFLQLFTC